MSGFLLPIGLLGVGATGLTRNSVLGASTGVRVTGDT